MAELTPTSDERARYWDTAYKNRQVDELSWFQASPAASLKLINQLSISSDAAIIDVGGGASSLADHLVMEGFADVSVLDIANAALGSVRDRLGDNPSVELICHDILTWSPKRQFDVWHDRAVFHFLVDIADQDTYLAVLRTGLRPGGAIIMASFAADGPEHCSGLPVARYSPQDLAVRLGGDFQTVDTLWEEHLTPAGVVQPFNWLVARRVPS